MPLAYLPGNALRVRLHLPQGAMTVLLRPFPWEVSSKLQILASLEGIALAGLIVYRRRSVALSLRRLRSSPFLFESAFDWVTLPGRRSVKVIDASFRIEAISALV